MYTHTPQRCASLSPSFNMDVCSSFMAAVVTGRYTTSGHLTSLGIGVGVGARSCESWAIPPRILPHPSVEDDGRICRALNMSPPPPAHLDCGVKSGWWGSERFLSQEAESSSRLWGARPDGRPVVWLSRERGMWGSHRRDGGRVRRLKEEIGGWDGILTVLLPVWIDLLLY